MVLLVEGAAEKKSVGEFIKRWLDARLSQRIGIQTVNMGGFGHFKNKAAKKARMHLDGPDKNRILAVIGLLDLYGPQASDFYPKYKQSVEERYEWAMKHFQNQVDHPRFRMFFAVHDFEAWLFSQPDIFPAEIQNNLPDNLNQPESINFYKPPSKMLDELYRSHRHKCYKKTVDGPKLFQKLEPSIAYDKCPHLKAMLDTMLDLARRSVL